MLKQLFKSVLLVAAALLMVGCINAQTNVSMYGDEQWSGVQAIQLAPEMVTMMEQSSEDTSVDTADIDDWLSNAEQAGGRSDIQVSFNEVKGEDGSQSYVLSASGTGYQTLNEVFFEGSATISKEVINGQKQITINYDFSDSGGDEQALTPEEEATQAEMMNSMGLSISFRISGGEIINSNATRVEGSTAVWETPSKINVTLTETPALDPATVALVPPPAGSGFSAAAMEALMDSISEEMASSTAGDDTGLTTQDSETATGVDSETSTSGPMDEATNTATTDPTADDVTLIANDSSDTAPAESEANLPSSGGELTDQSVTTQFVLSLFFVVMLLGGSALLGSRKRPNA
jgi:hypothetical protein